MSAERQKRYREKNKIRLSETRQHRKRYADFMNELATDVHKHDADFLASFAKKYPHLDTAKVAREYLALITKLGLSHQRADALHKPAMYKALAARFECTS
ncbi:hypothetical protein THF1C08_80240 [Vibrio jasicida]|uniref:Integrase n=1 Tax=Vibrio jasicida TaxID=766224 RepID=A0AAU9QWR6_9VIBR|nr:hypothetical protein THF1C08_80240 [Vibrio jasicida]CAH1603520.1 hypothetical protein THF1A12_70239 [Vibrio jasicida]